MADYVQDPNDSKKQIPGPKTDQHFDRASQPAVGTLTKQPHYVIVNVAETVSFLFAITTYLSSFFSNSEISRFNITFNCDFEYLE